MCGILLTYGIDKNRFLAGLEKLKHRGPFNSGYQFFDNVCVGMTQLPMKQDRYESLPVKYQDYCVAYNGEIYEESANSLTDEIETLIKEVNRGHLINGMYAFAAYNRKNNSISFGRDDHGIKPLYYYFNKLDKQIIISSELEAMLHILGSVCVDKTVIAEVVTFGTQITENTCFKNIMLVDQGFLIKLDLATFELNKKYIYSRGSSESDLDKSLSLSVSACSKSFRENMLLLSEGLDSNLLLSYLPEGIKKFNISLNQKSQVNTKKYSNLRQCHLDKRDFSSLLLKAIKNYGQPCRMSSVLMYQKLSDEIARHRINMALVGEGADELFWGYQRHKKLYEKKDKLTCSEVINIFFDGFERKTTLLDDAFSYDHVKNQWEALGQYKPEKDMLGFIELLDKKYSMEPLLRRTDHLLMSNTIEARLPFLHFGIPELSRRLGWAKVNDQHTKIPLVDLQRKRNSDYQIRVKNHFRAPLSDWFGEEDFLTFFKPSDLFILSELGISIDQLKKLRFDVSVEKMFVIFTLVAWYEVFKQYIRL